MSSLPDYRPLELMIDPKITKFEFDDFIGVWHNFMPRPFCDKIIEFMDQMIERGSNIDPGDSEFVYDSSQFYNGKLNRHDTAFLINYANREIVEQVNSILKSCAKHYVQEYQALLRYPMISTDIKAQKTPPGGGYHIWHHENADIAHAARELTWMIYLNDMPDGEAETEFLYQRRRIKPTAGTVVFWPTGFTHTHKGNTVLTQDKYILTGWYIKTK